MSIETVDMDATQLQREVFQLRRRVQKLTALLRVLLVVFRMSGYSLNQVRLPEGHNKRSLLRAIERSRSALPLRALLRVVRLSPVRYHAWSRKDACALDDRSSCPRSSPQQLTAGEVGVIQELMTSDDFRHVPTGTLARLAQRLGKVFASASTWYRLVREHRWRRPRQRVHPAAPKVGIRAARPNEIWHIDTSVLRRAACHDILHFCARVLAILADPGRCAGPPIFVPSTIGRVSIVRISLFNFSTRICRIVAVTTVYKRPRKIHWLSTEGTS